MAKHPPFFWLHIKKSAGTSVRKMLQPHYRIAERVRWPENFIQSDSAKYNDILNNYRVVLGKYQFRRSQFAQEFLFPEAWGAMVKFAFARDPVDRAKSMFTYLHRQGLRHRAARSLLSGKLLLSNSASADYFLDCVEAAHSGEANSLQGDLHFSTHTAPMYGDVTDASGKVILDRIYRLDSLRPALAQVLRDCGLAQTPQKDEVRLNRTGNHSDFEFNRAQKRRLETIYAQDFELYEDALHVKDG